MAVDVDFADPAFGVNGAEPPAPPTEDPDAPYGRKPDGTPYLISKSERDRRAAQMSAGRTRKAAERKLGSRTPPRRTPGAAPKPPKPATYAEMMAGILAIPAMALGMLGRFWPSLIDDSLALTYHTPVLAEAAEKMVTARPSWAAALEKAAEVGPWGEAVLAVLPLALQVAVNHGRAEPNPRFGVVSPAELRKIMGIKPADEDDGP